MGLSRSSGDVAAPNRCALNNGTQHTWQIRKSCGKSTVGSISEKAGESFFILCDQNKEVSAGSGA